jgi:nucleotide-binding universal stress UspA family protein
MGRYRKILVAIDGSEGSIHALKESFKLAENEGSWLTAISVVPPYQGDLEFVGIGNIRASMRKPYEEALSKAVELAKEEKAPIKTVCEEGEPHEKIVEIAEVENYDLIVMGRTGLHHLERVLVGSATARVIGYSPKDVLVIPINTSVGWQRALLATDGSRYSNTATEKAINFTKSYGGELNIISIVDVPAELYAESPKTVEDLINKAKVYVEDAKKQSEISGIKTETFVREGEAYRIITDFARQQNINIIVMGSHGRTGLKRLLMGSVTERVIGHASCPVLVVKA